MLKKLLIVDDELLVCSSLSRALRSHFDEVFTARTPSEAEQLLSGHAVTHLVSDCHLGADLPLGYELIEGWRDLCPSIVRAVVFSGTDLSTAEMPDSVDAVVSKAAGLARLLVALEID